MAGIVLCSFCHQEGDLDTLGELYTVGDLVVHQYCLYFSSGLAQTGDEEDKVDTICGFQLKDIAVELRRGRSIKCNGCLKPGGYVGCAVATCRKAGHFPCLHKLGFTFHYGGNFEAYCPKHCPTQPRLDVADKGNKECCICLAPLCSKFTSQVYCPCCVTLFHKTCIQKQALNAGRYYFRCPVCNDREIFCSEMVRIGVALPDRDAKWEVDVDYLSEESKYCKAEFCLCPQGRSHHAQLGKYRMRKCRTCGQCRGHVDCLRRDDGTECEDCSTVPLQVGPQHSKTHQRHVLVESTSNRTLAATLTTKVPIILIKKLTSKDISLINRLSSSSQ